MYNNIKYTISSNSYCKFDYNLSFNNYNSRYALNVIKSSNINSLSIIFNYKNIYMFKFYCIIGALSFVKPIINNITSYGNLKLFIYNSIRTHIKYTNTNINL